MPARSHGSRLCTLLERALTSWRTESLFANRPRMTKNSCPGLPNGSRLSCGRNARGRKVVEQQTKRLAGEAPQFFPTCARPAASSAC